MNLYITGLNQVTDIEIDKINKPYLPIAAGRLSEANGKLIVLLSLFCALLNIRQYEWPLQATLLGSALLGTVYSAPPFRLKRFPLLAALCILVVRGSLVNMGFFLQAKASVLGATAAKTATATTTSAASTIAGGASIASLVSSMSAVTARYPESVLLTSFFALFGVVIALLKDVPDVRGDQIHRIPSFSVRLGPMLMLRYESLHFLRGILLI